MVKLAELAAGRAVAPHTVWLCGRAITLPVSFALTESATNRQPTARRSRLTRSDADSAELRKIMPGLRKNGLFGNR
jgi:hypothetical protein